MLTANHRRVQRRTPTEVWLFNIGCVLAAFGAGLLIARYHPQLVGALGWPAVVAGLLCLVIASRGLRRPAPLREGLHHPLDDDGATLARVTGRRGGA